MQQQKAQLIKQREDYVKKVAVLRHELEQLRIQKQELVGDGRSSNRDLNNILKENDKLQVIMSRVVSLVIDGEFYSHKIFLRSHTSSFLFRSSKSSISSCAIYPRISFTFPLF